MYLIWLFYRKFDLMLTPEDREKRDYAEFLMFKYNVLFKLLSVGILGYFLSRRRHKNPNYLYDGILLYSAGYSFILSYVYGVQKAWPIYKDVAKKMIKS